MPVRLRSIAAHAFEKSQAPKYEQKQQQSLKFVCVSRLCKDPALLVYLCSHTERQKYGEQTHWFPLKQHTARWFSLCFTTRQSWSSGVRKKSLNITCSSSVVQKKSIFNLEHEKQFTRPFPKLSSASHAAVGPSAAPKRLVARSRVLRVQFYEFFHLETLMEYTRSQTSQIPH